MAQETLVLPIDGVRARALRERLEGAGYELRGAPYAHFTARGEGVVVTAYQSGKLVVQGGSAQDFARRFLDAGAAAAPASALESADLIGSDECGKGDYFGPLVVVALELPAGMAAKLREGGVTDSKKLSDAHIERLAGGLAKHFRHAIELLEPPEYNAMHARVGNLNPMLASLHARAIRKLYRPGIRVLIDQFAKPELMRRELADLDIELLQRTHGEEEMAVAAASCLARATYLERLRALSDEYAVDLHPGAGAPTDRAAHRYVELHGFDKLGRVAKVHFRNTQRLRASRDE